MLFFLGGKMKKRIKTIRTICENLDIPDGKLTDEYLFTLVGMDYFFFNGNIGAKDIQDGFVDGANDGGIDFIHSSDETLFLIQGKSQSTMSGEELQNVFDKMYRTVKAFDDGKYDSFNKTLKSVYLNSRDNLPDNANTSFVLFTNAIINSEVLQKFYKNAENSHLKDFDIKVYDGNMIEVKSHTNDMENEFVEYDKIMIEKANNCLEYGDNGVIVNIMASSLKDIFHKHQQNGLFNYNLREHISQKNVDSGIDNSIKKEPEYFWFYNNGVTFACEEFELDGNLIKLFNFSIINGAQTTTKIGKSPYISKEKDFCLVCKIVRTPKLKDDFDFVAKISEASNSQKPIKLRDLRANKPEQKLLQIRSAKSGTPLAVEIKRGVRPSNYSKVEKWQRVKNEYLGQLILSMLLQKPGTARSGKSHIFGSDKVYNQIFRRTHDFNTLYDLVKLGSLYDDFKVDFTKTSTNIEYIGIARNGKFVILSLIMYMTKRKRGIIADHLDENLMKDNVEGSLIQKYNEDDFEKILNEIFRYIIKVLNDIYKSKIDELKLTSYSNFFKTDKTYVNHILNEFDLRVYDDEFDYERVERYMRIFD